MAPNFGKENKTGADTRLLLLLLLGRLAIAAGGVPLLLSMRRGSRRLCASAGCSARKDTGTCLRLRSLHLGLRCACGRPEEERCQPAPLQRPEWRFIGAVMVATLYCKTRKLAGLGWLGAANDCVRRVDEQNRQQCVGSSTVVFPMGRREASIGYESNI